MTEAEKEKLLQKKQALHLKLQRDETVDRLKTYWLPLYEAIVQHAIPHRIEYLTCVTESAEPLWKEALNKDPFLKYHFPETVIKTPETFYIYKQLIHFPNTLPLRYLPDLPHQTQYDEPATVLAQAAETLQIKEEDWVYFFYLPFAPVLCVPFKEILKHPDVFYYYLGIEDICILPLSFDWLIFRSLEEEWRWGKRM